MKIGAFDCCHKYNECSDVGSCINDKDHKEACNYWLRHLSKGVAFYGKNPGLREGNIYIEIDNRSFRISKRYKDLAYSMDREHINVLTEEFKRLEIKYSIQVQGHCIIVGCLENPAKYKIDFAIGEYQYTIKNFNGYLLEREAVTKIFNVMGETIKLTPNPPLANLTQRTNFEYSGYYGRDTVFVIDEGPTVKLPDQPREQPKQVAQKSVVEGKWVQVSIWDIM